MLANLSNYVVKEPMYSGIMLVAAALGIVGDALATLTYARQHMGHRR